MISKERLKERAPLLVRRILIGFITGLLVGLICALLAHGIYLATDLRNRYPYLLLLMPLGGILIAFLYNIWDDLDDKGTNLVLTTIRGDTYLPLHKIPEVFFGTLLSHLVGASVGRTGSALQLGGNVAFNTASLLGMDEEDRKIATISGMGAAFTIMFSSPVSGAFFGMEVPHIGHFYYPAILPCMIAAVTSHLTVQVLGVRPITTLTIGIIPELTGKTAALSLVIALFAALLSAIYCELIQLAGKLHKKYVRYPYRRAVIGSLIFMVFYALLASEQTGGDFYRGAGMDYIPLAIAGELPWFAFLLKILFCMISIFAGFRGGEIGPGLMIGASFSAFCANVFPVSPDLCAGVCMSAMLAGITNCPVSALFFTFSLFGYHGAIYWMIGVVVGYACSGHSSIYAEQNLLHPK